MRVKEMWKSKQYLQKTSFTSNFQSCFSCLSCPKFVSAAFVSPATPLFSVSSVSLVPPVYMSQYGGRCEMRRASVAAKKFRYAVAKNTTKPEIAFCALHVVSSTTVIYLFAPFYKFDVSSKCLILLNTCRLAPHFIHVCSNLITPGGIPSNLGNPAPGHCYHLLDYNRLPLQDLRECFERKRYRVPILHFLWILFKGGGVNKNGKSERPLGIKLT